MKRPEGRAPPGGSIDATGRGRHEARVTTRRWVRDAGMDAPVGGCFQLN